MPSARLSPEEPASLGGRLLAAAGVLMFLGSSIYLPPPLRPFHWGLALIALAFCVDAPTRRGLLQSRVLPAAVAAMLLVGMQFAWADHLPRYAQYAVILAISLSYALLGEHLTRQGSPYLRWLPWLVGLWLLMALVPWFDILTHSERFRARFPLTGGPWDNINNMATALVVANLLWLVVKRRLSSALFAVAWLYCLVLNRRADMLAMAVLGAAYLLCFLQGSWRRKAAMALAWAAISAAGLLWQEYDGTSTRDLPQISINDGEWELVASKGDQSTGSRKILLMDMAQQARDMPWWQWVAGMGAGQLNVMWPTHEGLVPWGSPHFFWLEMLFYLGIAWPLFLLWLFWKLDWLGRTCLLVIGIAGIAPSSMVYFQPFWFLLGALLAQLPRPAPWRRRQPAANQPLLHAAPADGPPRDAELPGRSR